MPDRLPLLGGSYAARSVIASCTRCVNYYPEKNPKEAPVPLTHYQRPGLKRLSVPPAQGAGRNVWSSSDGQGWAVVGAQLFYIAPDWSWTLVGPLTSGLTTPCSLIDNGIEVVVADGSPSGWRVDLVSHAFTPITDISFTGATRLDYIDTFVIWNVPGTKNFRSTLSNQIEPMDPLYIAGKTNWPDPLKSLIVNRHEIMLLGRVKTEKWYDAGDPQFPFAELPGSYIEHGLVATYSLASADIAVYWLGQDLQGQGVVFRQRGYDCERISNHALEFALRKMYLAGTISDAIGYTYQQDGHLFYVLQFPTGNQTWVYDESIGDAEIAWHQRAWTDGDGKLNRERNNGFAYLYGKMVTIDWEDGTLYQMDPDSYLDEVGGQQGPISWIRTFPHLMSGLDPISGAAILANGLMVEHNSFQLDIEVGNSPIQDQDGPVYLRWSDDRGKTWGNAVLQSTGKLGQYATRPNWNGLGQAMDRVYEVSHSQPCPAALNGAWISGKVLQQ